jgi:hypothetical protein
MVYTQGREYSERDVFTDFQIFVFFASVNLSGSIIPEIPEIILIVEKNLSSNMYHLLC